MKIRRKALSILAGGAPAAIVTILVVTAAFQRIPLPNPYVNEAYGFSIQYPESWMSIALEREVEGDLVHVASFWPVSTESERAVILIHIHQLNDTNFRDFYAEREAFLLSADNATKLAQNKWDGPGHDGQVSEYTFFSTISDNPERLKRYETVGRDSVYVLTFVATLEEYDTYHSDFENAVESFRIL